MPHHDAPPDPVPAFDVDEACDEMDFDEFVTLRHPKCREVIDLNHQATHPILVELAELKSKLAALEVGQANLQKGVTLVRQDLAVLSTSGPQGGTCALGHSAENRLGSVAYASDHGTALPPSDGIRASRISTLTWPPAWPSELQSARRSQKGKVSEHRTDLVKQKSLLLSPRWSGRELPPDTQSAWPSACSRASRNAFGGMGQTEEDDLRALQEIFSMSEEEEAKAQYWSEIKKKPFAYVAAVRANSSQSEWEMVVDALVAVLVVVNCICIGFQMDYSEDDPSVWISVDITFTLVFLFEIGMKLYMHGFRGHFCGSSKYSNAFDTSIVFVDVVSLVLSVVSRGETDIPGALDASILRVVRLGKLSRVHRVLRQPVFYDVVAMLEGMIGGITTLFWAIMLFLTAIYVVALVFRESFGRRPVDNVSGFFDSVPRAMFTTFRCSFGDCTSAQGQPIFEHVHEHYGHFFSLLYCFFLFVVTIGLFNVISAIFVESTLNSAAQLALGKKMARLQDDKLWSKHVSTLVRRLLVLYAAKEPDVKLTEVLAETYDLDVPCAAIDQLATDTEAIVALNALDIVPEDRNYLSEILDPDNGGTINVIELVDGLKRLRGEPRRSDIVTLNLMLRSLQRNVADISTSISKLNASGFA